MSAEKILGIEDTFVVVYGIRGCNLLSKCPYLYKAETVYYYYFIVFKTCFTFAYVLFMGSDA